MFSKVWLIKEGMSSCTCWPLFDLNWAKNGRVKSNLAIKMSNITILTSLTDHPVPSMASNSQN